jgi:hypothetical protein
MKERCMEGVPKNSYSQRILPVVDSKIAYAIISWGTQQALAAGTASTYRFSEYIMVSII